MGTIQTYDDKNPQLDVRPTEEQFAEALAEALHIFIKTDCNSKYVFIYENGAYREISTFYLSSLLSSYTTELIELAILKYREIIQSSDAKIRNCSAFGVDYLGKQIVFFKENVKMIVKSGGNKIAFTRNVIDFILNNRYLVKFAEELNLDKNLLVVNNGVLDLTNLELAPHDPDLFITNKVNVAFKKSNPENWGKDWLRFKQMIIEACYMEGKPKHENEAYVESVIQLIAYMTFITGNPAKNIYIIHGPTNTGKSTVIEILTRIFGNAIATIDSSALVKSGRSNNDIRPEIVSSKDAKLIVAVEAKDDMVFDTAFLKRLSGNDQMKLRKPHKESEVFYLQGKICLATNEIPAFSETDGAFVKRLVFIYFANTVPDDKIDRNLVDTLTCPAAREEIFSALAHYANGYLKTGTLKLHPWMALSKDRIVLAKSDLTTTWFNSYIQLRPVAQPSFLQPKWSSSYIFQEFCKWCQTVKGVEPVPSRTFYFQFRDIASATPAITFHRTGQRNHYTGFDIKDAAPDPSFQKELIDLLLSKKVEEAGRNRLDADQAWELLWLFLLLQ